MPGAGSGNDPKLMGRDATSDWWQPWVAALAACLLAEAGVRVLEAQVAPLSGIMASGICAVLEWLGMTVVRAGEVLSHPGGFSYQIGAECLCLSPVVALAAFLLQDRSLPRFRAACAFFLGAALLLTLNLARLVSLFWLGTHDAQVFGMAHDLLWPLVLILAFLATVHRARKPLAARFVRPPERVTQRT